jgi:tetratricopeptide (TPR) repeat protein
MNSFLSTSLNPQGARSFLQSADASDDVEQVFFEIDADPRLDNIKPFSDITLLSCLPTEKEVLFMIGSIFRIVEMKRESDGIWNIRMTLCSENDHQLQSLFQHMKNELGTGTTDLYTFGRVLRQMSRLSDAEKYYHRYLNQLSADHPNISLCYGALGRVTSDKGEYDSSLKWHNKSLEIEMKTLRLYHPDIAFTHNSIAVVYSMKGDYGRALESYEKALMIWKKAYDEDHPQVATCLDNMGCVYQLQKKYFQALQFHQKALILRQKHLPADHPEIGASHNNIGNIHRCLGNYDQALEHYILDLNISKKSLPPEHPGIGETLVNIGLVHEGKGDYQQALSYLNKAINIFLHSLSPKHPSVIKTDQCIKQVLAKWK